MHFIYILSNKSTIYTFYFVFTYSFWLYTGERKLTGSHLETYTIDEMTRARRAVPRTTETTTTASKLPGNTHRQMCKAEQLRLSLQPHWKQSLTIVAVETRQSEPTSERAKRFFWLLFWLEDTVYSSNWRQNKKHLLNAIPVHCLIPGRTCCKEKSNDHLDVCVCVTSM